MKKIAIFAYILDVVLIIMLSFIYYLNLIVKTNEVIYIPKGSINQIISYLKVKNYDVCKLDSIILRFIGKPQSGWIYIGTTKLTRADFLYKLTTAKAALEDITLIPGETTYIFLNQLSKELNLDRIKLQYEFDKLSPFKEGAFVPNTYKLPIGITEKMVISLLLKNSLYQMKKFSYKIFGSYNEKKWLKYLIIASIIQKESASKEEMPLVSSVIHNRLKKGMKLQMDGSLNYGKYSHIKITSKRIRKDKSKYNTYMYKGLPPYPVCNVSFDAIKAAIFPAHTSYLYFMKQKNKKHAFSSTYKGHIQNIKNVTKSNYR